MALSKIKSDSIDSIDAAKIPNLDASKIATGTVDNARITLDAAEIPNLDAAKITTGDIALARLGNAPATDLIPIRQDIAMLALYNAVSDNRAAYNLPYSFIDQFEDDTGLTTQTDVDRNADEYVSTSYFGAQTEVSRTDGTAIGNATGRAGLAAAFDGDITQGHTSSAGHGSAVASSYVGKDWGSGVTKTITGMKYYTADGSSSSIYWTSTSGGTFTVTLEGSTDNFSSSIVSLGTIVTGVAHNDTQVLYENLVPGTFITNTAYRYHRANTTGSVVSEPCTAEVRFYESAVTFNATGTLISDTQTSSVATTKMSGVILYKDNAGTATLGTHLKIYLSADNGSNWTEVPSYGAVTPLFSTGVKMVRLGETTVTSGTAPVMKAVWASQASGTLETQLHGWAMNY